VVGGVGRSEEGWSGYNGIRGMRVGWWNNWVRDWGGLKRTLKYHVESRSSRIRIREVISGLVYS